MTLDRWKRPVAYGASLAVLAAGSFIFISERSKGEDPLGVSDPVRPLAAMPFPVSLSNSGPAGGPIGSIFTLTVEDFAEKGVDSVVLYDGARPVASGGPGPDGSTDLEFSAVSPGLHTLFAEVTDEDGLASYSPPTIVRVTGPRQAGPVVIPLNHMKDESPRDLADRTGLKLSQVLASSGPGGATLPADEPIPPHSTVVATIDTVQSPSTSRFTVDQGPPPSGKLSIMAQGNGCQVKLSPQGASGPVTYVEATNAGWIEVGSQPASRALLLKELTPGHHVYAGQTGDGRAGQISAPVTISVPDKCVATAGWTGNARILDGILTVDTKPSKLMYIYLQVDGTPARRLPANQNSGYPAALSTDISRELPRLVGTKLDLEVWEAGEFPHRVATGQLKVSQGESLQSVVGEPQLLTLTTSDGSTLIDMGNDDGSVEFDWVSDSDRVDKVAWQVLTSRPASQNLSLVPDGLLASGASESQSAKGQRSHGSFVVDTSKIPGHAEVAGPLKKKSPFGPPATAKAAVTAQTATSLGPGSYATIPVDVSSAASILVQGYVPAPAAGDPVFVRVLALPAEGGATSASESATLVLPTVENAADGDPVDMVIDDISVNLGRAPNLGLSGCVRVTVPWADPTYQAPNDAEAASAGFLRSFYPEGGTYCPSDFPPPAECGNILCDVIDGAVGILEEYATLLVSVYSMVSDLYGQVIDITVQLVAKGPFCAAIKAASPQAGSDCEAVTSVVARAAISAVLASVGLPPSLPSAQALASIAEGELDLLAVELMKQAGVPCDDFAVDPDLIDAVQVVGGELGGPDVSALKDPCLAMAQVFIGGLRDQVIAGAEQSVSIATGMPYIGGITGFALENEPKSLPDPWVVEMTAHPKRAAAQTDGLFCTIRVKQESKPGITSHVKAYLIPSGKGKFKGSAVLTPYQDAATQASLDGLSVMLSLKPYVSQCRHDDKVITGAVGPAEPR